MIKRIAIVTVLVVSLVAAAFGDRTLPPPRPPIPPGLTVALVEKLQLSSATYFSTLWWLTHPSSAADAMPHASDLAASKDAVGNARVTPYDVTYFRQMTTNTIKDAEPTNIVQQTGAGTFSTTVAIQVRTATDFSNVSHTVDSMGGQYPDQELPFPNLLDGWVNPAGYHVTADPLMSENPYSTGIAQKRVYTVGIAHSGAVYTHPTGVALWRSDDGGVTWSRPAHVAQADVNNVFYDKPSITTCWNNGCVGEVYVAYTFLGVGQFPEIHVARSTDGGLSFSQDVTVAQGPDLTSSQILSDYWNGALYVLWEDFSNNRIVRRTSTDRGATWGPEEVVANTALVRHNNTLQHGTVAGSVIMARYNMNAQRINVVWHAYEADMIHTQLMFATQASGTPWSVNLVQGVNNTNDQFLPALDYNNAGNVLIGYYSRKDDVNNQNYRPYYVIISADNTVNVHPEEWYVNASYDPTATNEALPNWIGDYQDVWFSGEYNRFQHSWIGRPANSYEVFLTRAW